MKEHKMLRQNIESRKRVEEYQERYEEKMGVELTLSQAEAVLTKIAIKHLDNLNEGEEQ